MPEVRVNLGAKTSFEALPNGIVRVSVAKYDITTSKAGDEMHVAQLQISEPESAKGRLLFANFVQKPQAMWSHEQFLNAIGIETPDAEDMEARESFSYDTDEIKGAELLVKIGPATEGFNSNSVDSFMSLGDAEVGLESEVAASVPA